MIPPLPFAAFSRARRCQQAGFTMVEVLIAACLTAFLMVAVFSGIVSLQKSYSATEIYGTGLADQMRVLDYLAQDLRRAISPGAGTAPWALDSDAQGLKITVPDYYHFNGSDPQHLFPIANSPTYDSTVGFAYYSSVGAAASPATNFPTQVIAYRYTNGTITRADPWQPLVANGTGGYQAASPVVIATSMDAFPTIGPDNNDSTGAILRYAITFYSTFQPLAVRGGSNTGTITLHNVTFVRSKNLSR